MIRVEVIKRFKLPARIDKHHPIGVTFRITGGLENFRLTVITVNWGRGYQTHEFKRSVLDVMNKIGEREYVVILFQELDEADPANEHVIVAQMMEPGTTLVRWETREPIAVSPGVSVKRKRAVTTMEQGTKIGGPVGTGPRRKYVSCIVTVQGVVIGFGNQHPHRYSIKHWKVARARRQGESVVENEIWEILPMVDLFIDGGDLNTTRYPKQHPRQRNIYRVGYDYIRLIRTRRK
jgi:hypothetical protein